jgi:predicted anti-sigma-YlaC factor YlaD
MLTCKEVSVLLSQAEDRRLGAMERLTLEAHLKLCEGCRQFHEQLGFLRRAIRRHPALRDEDDER